MRKHIPFGSKKALEDEKKLKRATQKNKETGSKFIGRTTNELRAELKHTPPPRKLIGGLIYEGEQSIIFGPTNVGKSIFGVQIAEALSEGKDLILGGETLENESEPMNVVYFDFELSDSQFLKRIGKRDFNENFVRLSLKRGEILAGKPKEIFDYLKEASLIYEAKIIIIDNITKIGNRLEESDRAAEFMSSLWDLCRYENYTIIIMAHTPKRDKKIPITADSMSGSSKLSQLSDALIGINEMPSEDSHTKVYLKQIKSRNGFRKYGEMNVITMKIVEDEVSFVKHQGLGTLSELAAINGSESNHIEKQLATACIIKYGSSRKAEAETGINHNTLWKRKKSLQDSFPELYEKIQKMSPSELDEYIILLQAEAQR